MPAIKSNLCAKFAVVIISVVPAFSTSFSFYSTLRAGQPANADYEIGLGSNSTADDSTGQFRYSNADPGWRGGDLPQRFEIGFNTASQRAYATVWNGAGSPTTVQFANTSSPLSANAIWTLPAASFFVSAAATSRPSSINVENLQLSSGVQVLSGALPTSLGAAQPPAVTSPMSAPLVINPAANGGNWYISGTIRFSGLVSAGGSAQGSQLQFLVRAMGADNPEPLTVLTTVLGLLALYLRRPGAKAKET